MGLYWIKTPAFIKGLFSNHIWDIPNNENKVYLTFDDGPTPEITEWVMDILKKHNIKATFFCIGKNIHNHPEIYLKLIEEGHVVGNHTFDHLNGWKASCEDYIENVLDCDEKLDFRTLNLEKSQIENTEYKIKAIFRPPYGKIKQSQSKEIREMGNEIIMWDILSGDFDENISPEKCLQNATRKVTSGSIILFHDSKKAFKNLEYALPKTIEILKGKGFQFDIIKNKNF
jgi:peptidoglycan-N-acetylglucosamine deacetylase